MDTLSNEIREELKDSEGKKHLLTATQYRLLRIEGKTKEEVAEFEIALDNEIQRRDSPVFIPSLWVERRVEGYQPDQIEYDWVHAFR